MCNIAVPFKEPLAAEELQKCEEINKLFDAALDLRGASKERFLTIPGIFKTVLGAGHWRMAYYAFLHNVLSCPQEVLLFCQNTLREHRS